jgi:Na+/H+ antiporter NhaC
MIWWWLDVSRVYGAGKITKDEAKARALVWLISIVPIIIVMLLFSLGIKAVGLPVHASSFLSFFLSLFLGVLVSVKMCKALWPECMERAERHAPPQLRKGEFGKVRRK